MSVDSTGVGESETLEQPKGSGTSVLVGESVCSSSTIEPGANVVWSVGNLDRRALIGLAGSGESGRFETKPLEGNTSCFFFFSGASTGVCALGVGLLRVSRFSVRGSASGVSCWEEELCGEGPMRL